MNIKKFNERMGRPKFSKGGYIKKLGNRHYFDAGGIAQNATIPGVVSGNSTNTTTNGIGGIAQALGLNAASANINQGTNAAQLNNAYGNVNNALNAQVGLTNTLTPQAQTAAQNQNAVAQQELAMTQGQGPNPAQTQLAQSTGQNVNQESALLAGQRGSNANVGLAGRNIAQTGAQTQQTAAGQAATLEAQQQIAAQNNLTNLSNQQVNQAQGATTALNQGQQNEQNILQNANTSGNNAAVSMQGNINNNNAAANSSLMGGLTSGLGAVAGLLNKGGDVHPVHGKQKLEFIHKMAKMGMEHYDGGGYTSSEPSSGPTIAAPAPSSSGSSGGGGSGGGGLGLLALLADGGKVATPSPSPSHPGISLGAPAASASDVTPANMSQSQMQNVMSGFKQMKADGGTISANPLLAGITNSPQSLANQGGYSSSEASSGPGSLGGPSGAGADLGKSASQGFAATHKAPGDPMAGSSNDIADSSGVAGGAQWAGVDSSAAPSSVFDTGAAGQVGPSQMNVAKGGEIWSLHPSQHAAYSANHFARYFAKGGEAKEVKAMVSPGERYWNPEEVEQIKHGADPMKLGKIFPGKAKVPGKDTLKNDTVPETLQEGGIVNPLHVEKTKNPDKARLFILKSLKATGKHLKRPAGMK